eukprot:Opistho-2@83071
MRQGERRNGARPWTRFSSLDRGSVGGARSAPPSASASASVGQRIYKTPGARSGTQSRPNTAAARTPHTVATSTQGGSRSAVIVGGRLQRAKMQYSVAVNVGIPLIFPTLSRVESNSHR